MIAQVRGIVIERSPTAVVVEVGGVGLALSVPLSTFDRVPDEGREVSLFTYLHVREDALVLYGFAARDERELFLALIGVSGVGPRLALACLSGARADDLRSWIREGQVAALTRVPGVGRKTAERIIVELKERLGAAPVAAGVSGSAAARSAIDEAALALEALGVREARERIAEIIRAHATTELAPEEIVRLALARSAR
ncbi:MAG: Holliday junction branch migration protein RuvA [bacterium]